MENSSYDHRQDRRDRRKQKAKYRMPVHGIRLVRTVNAIRVRDARALEAAK